MRIVLLVVSALLWLVLPAYTKSGADCATFQNDGKRLLCYDLLFKTGHNRRFRYSNYWKWRLECTH